LRKGFAAAAAVAVVAAITPGVAAGATVTGGPDSGTTRPLVFEAGAGEVNQVTVTRSGANIVFTDPGANLGPAGTCVAGADAHSVNCPDGAPAITTVTVAVHLNDGDDHATTSVPNTTILGGPGKDVITGSDFNDIIDGQNDEDTVHGGGGNDSIGDSIDDGAPNHLFGGPGDDGLTGSSGNDDLHGEDGNDSLVGDFGADLLDGGDGFDTVSYGDRGPDAASGVSVTLSGGAATGAGAPGENDTLQGIEDLAGTGRNDTLVGDAGPNVIQGFAGDDAISGGPGYDILYGGQGNDSIDAVDGGSDRVACGGEGTDTASVDSVDSVAGCVGLNVVPTAGPDQTPPKVGITYAKSIRLRTFRAHGIGFTVFSSDKTVANTLTAEMLGRVRSVKSFSKAAVGDLLLATRSLRLTGRVRVRLHPSKRYRGHLRRGQYIRLRVTINDPSRNRAAKIVRVRLK
jgi:Ca2+-binding RTX toxin-like protein